MRGGGVFSTQGPLKWFPPFNPKLFRETIWSTFKYVICSEHFDDPEPNRSGADGRPSQKGGKRSARHKLACGNCSNVPHAGSSFRGSEQSGQRFYRGHWSSLSKVAIDWWQLLEVPTGKFRKPCSPSLCDHENANGFGAHYHPVRKQCCPLP